MGFTVTILGYSFIATVLTNLSPFLSENEQLQNVVLLFVVGVVLFIGGMWVAIKAMWGAHKSKKYLPNNDKSETNCAEKEDVVNPMDQI